MLSFAKKQTNKQTEILSAEHIAEGDSAAVCLETSAVTIELHNQTVALLRKLVTTFCLWEFATVTMQCMYSLYVCV